MSDRAKCAGIVLGTTLVVGTLSSLGWKHYWYYYWFYSLNFGEHIKHCTAQKPRSRQRRSRGGRISDNDNNNNNGELVHPPLPQHLRELLSACRLACVIDAKHYYETNHSVATGMFLTRFTYVRNDNDNDNDVIVMSVNPRRERNRLGALRLLESCRRAPTEVALLVHTANARLNEYYAYENIGATANANANANAVAKARSEERKSKDNERNDKTDNEYNKPTPQTTKANAKINAKINANANANANINSRSPLSVTIRGSCRILTGDASDQTKYRTAHREHHPDQRRFQDDDDGDPSVVFLAVDVTWARLVMGSSGSNNNNNNKNNDNDNNEPAVARAQPMVGTATTPGLKKVLWGLRAVAGLVSSVRVVRR